MAKKKPKQTRATGGGRKSAYGEETVPFSTRLPLKVMALLDGLARNRTEALVSIVRSSIQYRLKYGSEEQGDD